MQLWQQAARAGPITTCRVVAGQEHATRGGTHGVARVRVREQHPLGGHLGQVWCLQPWLVRWVGVGRDVAVAKVILLDNTPCTCTDEEVGERGEGERKREGEEGRGKGRERERERKTDGKEERGRGSGSGRGEEKAKERVRREGEGAGKKKKG